MGRVSGALNAARFVCVHCLIRLNWGCAFFLETPQERLCVLLRARRYQGHASSFCPTAGDVDFGLLHKGLSARALTGSRPVWLFD